MAVLDCLECGVEVETSPKTRKISCPPCRVKRRNERHRAIKRRYGLTLDGYNYLFARPGGVCAICGTNDWSSSQHNVPHVDHDHATGVVRGILCHRCNVAIGMARDSATTLDRAAAYVRNGGVK